MPYKGGTRKKATLKYDRNLYTPIGATELTDKELRKEYSRLRSIARKRLERFEGTEWTTSQIYRYNKEGFKPLKDIDTSRNNRELRHALSDVARFVTAERGSVSGLERERRKAVKTLQERGYTFITKKNFRKFGEFMEYARASSLGRLYDSKRIADFYEATERRNLSSEDLRNAFNSWKRKQRRLSKIQNKSKKDSAKFRKALE